MFLEVRGLKKTYLDGKIMALNDISFTLGNGEILGVLGGSGAGKSSLLRILRGFEPFDSGLIKIGDIEVRPDSPKSTYLELQEKTAIQLQRNFGLWPDSPAENVIRAIRYSETGEESMPQDEAEYEEYRAKAMELLKIVRLEGRADLWSEVLSGGEKQRLIVARQIARRPKLLLLDEPGTMTCPETRIDLIDALRRANKELDMAIIFASHNPDFHRALAKRMIRIDAGKIADSGDVDGVLSRYLSKIDAPLPKTALKGPVAMTFKDVSKVYKLIPYGKVFELHNTNLEFRRGEITGIIGPSGAGKTVILRMLAGLEMPDAGEASVLYKDEWIKLQKLGRASMHARRQIGILHQEFDLSYWSRVLELFAAKVGIKDYNMVEGALERARKAGISDETVDAIHRVAEMPDSEIQAKLREIGIDRDILKELFRSKDPETAKDVALSALGLMGLGGEMLDRHVYELSGGEKVRIALALAVIAKPRILILDEPFGDLDPLTLRKVSNSLKRIKQSLKPAIVLVSHQLDFVEEVSDRCVLIEDGKVVADGRPKEVVSRFMERCEHV
jgi:methyl coenzyme M reductase system subunit A2